MSAPAEDFSGTRRYTPSRLLGAGSWGRVYQAYDNERNAFVAVKLLTRASPEALIRFKREFRALKDVVHPNLVTLYELFSDRDQWFFTMEFVDGRTLLDYVHGPRASYGRAASSSSTSVSLPAITVDWRRPPGIAASTDPTRSLESPAIGAATSMHAVMPPPTRKSPALPRDALDRLRHALGQLVDGLYVLHHAGKLHRDVKPSNVLVTADGRVTLLDFGLVQELEEDQRKDPLIVGTPAYMSPEQSIGAPVREATDWYAVGVLLFEALTGQVPFEGGAAPMLQARREQPAPRPSQLADGVPPDLDELCHQLLQRDVDARPTGDELRKRLVRPAPQLRRRPIDSTSPLLGRDAELAALHAGLSFVRENQRAALMLVDGASGLGKSALLQRFVAEANTPDTMVLDGRCGEMETVPFKAFDAIVDELTAWLGALPTSRRDRLLPKDFAALARLFPVLRRIELPDALKGQLPPADAYELRRRGFVALRELLEAISHVATVALVLDDAHFGDADSAALLTALLKAPEFPPLLLVAAFRPSTEAGAPSLRPSEVFDHEPVVRTLKAAARATPDSNQVLFNRITLNPLSAVAAKKLVLGQLADPTVDVDALVKEGRGSPHLLELLCAIASQKAHTHEDWARALLATLPAPARRLLEVVAVARRPIERMVAWHAAALDTEVADPLVPLKAARLVASDGGAMGRQERLFAYSTDIGRAVRALVPPDVARATLQRLVDAIESSGRIDYESVADWYTELQDLGRAARAAEAAADRATQVLAFDRAAALYEKAAIGRDQTDQRRLTLLRARALAGAGRGREAAALFLTLASTAERPDALDLRQWAAEQLLFGGHVDAGIAVLSEVMAGVGEPLPRSHIVNKVLTVINRVRVEVRGLDYTLRPESEISREQLARADAYFAAAKGFSLIDPMRGANFQFSHLRLALDAGEPYRVARALGFEAGFHALIGYSHRDQSMAALDALARLLASHPNEHAEGLKQLMTGCEALGRGAFNEARPFHQRAVEHFRDRCPGMTWELSTALQYLVHELWNMGDYQQVRSMAADVRDWATARRDAYALTNFRVRSTPIIRLMDDDPAGAHREVEQALGAFSRSGYYTQHFWGFQGQLVADLYIGNSEGALERVRAEWPKLKTSGLMRIQLARVMTLHHKASVQVFDPNATAAKLEKDAKALDAEGVPWASGLAAMVRAAHAFRFGDTPKAVAFLQRAADQLDATGALTHAWAARRWQAVLSGSVGRPLEQAADKWFRERGVREPARFAAAFCAGPWTA